MAQLLPHIISLLPGSTVSVRESQLQARETSLDSPMRNRSRAPGIKILVQDLPGDPQAIARDLRMHME